ITIDVDSGHAGTRLVFGDTDGDRARSRPNVSHFDLRLFGKALADLLQSRLDQDFSLRTGDEAASVDQELDREKFPLPRDVGDRFPVGPARDGTAVRVDLGGGQRAIVLDVELNPLKV